MNSTLRLITELLGGVFLFFAAGWIFARATGSDEYYDKMLYDDDDTDSTNNSNKTNSEDDIHSIYF